MLLSLTVVGATRQSFTKTLAVTDADAATVVASAWVPAAPPGLPTAEISADPRRPGLVYVTLEGLWLGTPAARDEAFHYLGALVRALADAAHRAGGALHAPGVRLSGSSPPAAGDPHTLYVTDRAEQEVLVNLLRRHSPALIALCGRGAIGTLPDRVGSRWLADSREHLTTRYLASADPRHLDHVRADIRRRDGIADLTRMDIAPLAESADRPAAVLVRCLDAQLSLTDLRAQALLLAALALYARRKVRSGNREGPIPQATLEKNRARAVTQGLRAQFLQESGRGAKPADPVPARESVRRLLDELLLPLGRLEATAEELAPLLVPVEGPSTGLPPTRSQDLLAAAAGRGPHELAATADLLLHDSRPGGLLLESLRQEAPGRVELLLGSWTQRLARAELPRQSGSGGRRRQGGEDRGAKRPRGGADRGAGSGGSGKGQGGSGKGRGGGASGRAGQDRHGSSRRERTGQDRERSRPRQEGAGSGRQGEHGARGGSGDRGGTTARPDPQRGQGSGGAAAQERRTPRTGGSES
ncbi:hypothetical protein OG729_02770 [Streptomyces sp. NBC_00210]|uniref:hypothetical protein n=1 Tax=unclassified Streptomyces TaxID=2593676 RepID=UPI00324BCF5F